MTTIDDLINTTKPPETPDEIRDLVSAIMGADDVSEDERGCFGAGYVAGLSYAMAAGPQEAATEFFLRMHELDDDATP